MVNTNNLQKGSYEYMQEKMSETEKAEYQYYDAYYWFEYKTKLKWDDKMRILFNNMETDDVDEIDDIDESELDIAGLYKDLVSKQVVDSNVNKMNLFLNDLDSEFGEQLGEDIADTVGIFDDSDKGNLKKL